MKPEAIVNAALTALQAVLALIAEIKGQSGMTDDQILAEAQKLAGANDALFNSLKAVLSGE